MSSRDISTTNIVRLVHAMKSESYEEKMSRYFREHASDFIFGLNNASELIVHCLKTSSGDLARSLELHGKWIGLVLDILQHPVEEKGASSLPASYPVYVQDIEVDPELPCQ